MLAHRSQLTHPGAQGAINASINMSVGVCVTHRDSVMQQSKVLGETVQEQVKPVL